MSRFVLLCLAAGMLMLSGCAWARECLPNPEGKFYPQAEKYQKELATSIGAEF